MLLDYVRKTRINAELGLYDEENLYGCVSHNLVSLTAYDIDMLLTGMICCFKAIK